MAKPAASNLFFFNIRGAYSIMLKTETYQYGEASSFKSILF